MMNGNFFAISPCAATHSFSAIIKLRIIAIIGRTRRTQQSKHQQELRVERTPKGVTVQATPAHSGSPRNSGAIKRN